MYVLIVINFVIFGFKVFFPYCFWSYYIYIYIHTQGSVKHEWILFVRIFYFLKCYLYLTVFKFHCNPKTKRVADIMCKFSWRKCLVLIFWLLNVSGCECGTGHYYQLGVSLRQCSFSRIERIEQLKNRRSYNEINVLAWPEKAYIIRLKFPLWADPGPASNAQILISPIHRRVRDMAPPSLCMWLEENKGEEEYDLIQ